MAPTQTGRINACGSFIKSAASGCTTAPAGLRSAHPPSSWGCLLQEGCFLLPQQGAPVPGLWPPSAHPHVSPDVPAASWARPFPMLTLQLLLYCFLFIFSSLSYHASSSLTFQQPQKGAWVLLGLFDKIIAFPAMTQIRVFAQW